MEKTLRRLEAFKARGDDGKMYAVHGYEHLARVHWPAAAHEQWEPTGQAEYKLADGRPLDVDRDGAMRVHGSTLRLERIG
ncbi:MAG TPA: hypothetical protein VH041_02105 [Caldimonas sp.]|jgi:hypothetical protein|nr:hypothetical protein [Caldimonas sp.]HEX4233076.1 hypothetical protein [Caldimonas sp.]